MATPKRYSKLKERVDNCDKLIPVYDTGHKLK
jgi:hypothetical protein